MSDPWDSDPVAGGTAANDPWANDPVVGAVPKKPASWWDTISAIPETTLGQMKQSLGGTLRSLVESDPATQAMQEKTGDYQSTYWGADQPHIKFIAKKEGRSPEEVSAEYKKAATTDSEIAKKGADIYAAGSANIEHASPGDLTFWKKAVLSGGSSFISQLPTLAASVALRNPTPALAFASGSQYGQTYGEARDKNIEPGRAGLHAGFDAGVEGLMEYIPAKFLTDHAGGPVASLIVSTLWREGLTEAATTALQSANAKLSTRPEMTWEDYWNDILDTIGATMVSAPLMAGAAKGTQRIVDAAQRPKVDTSIGPQVPQGWLPPGAQGPLMAESAVNVPLTTPNIDEPTNIFDSATRDALLAQADAIDPTKIDDKAAEEARRVVEEYQKKQKTPALPGAETAWSQIATAPAANADDLAELGASDKSAANAANYANPNVGDRLDRTFLHGPEGYVGLTPREVMPTPGTFTLGVPSEDRPADYLRALHDSVEQWRTEFLPNDTVVLSNEQLFSNSAIGWHYTTDPSSHMIVPAVLRKPSKGLGAYNPNTQASAFYNATHEFGHAIITSKFFEGMSPEQASALKQQSQAGTITETNLPAPQQAVVGEYNSMKGRVLDGSMTAQQFLDEWMGPAKIGRKTFLEKLGVAPTAKAMDVVNALTRRAAENSTIPHEIGKRALRKQMASDFLSLEEYLAEQMSRHAYQRKWDQASPLGQFFKSALDSLRGFFVARKKDGTISAGTAFQDWLAGISKSNRSAVEPEILADNRKKAGTRAAKKATPAAKAGTPVEKKVKVKKVAHNVQSSTSERAIKKAFTQIKFLEKAKTITAEEGNNLRDLANREEWDEFIEVFQQHATKNVKFELDVDSSRKASTAGEDKEGKDWQKEKFDSRFFKAWFGDWRNDAASASVARVGVFLKGLDGSLTIDKDTSSPPLVMFAAAERVKANVPVYASTLRGAHFIEANMPDGTAEMVPVVMNIRMPYIIDGIPKKLDLTQEQIVAEGYDGIVYLNGFDGEVSFIAFNGDQVKVVDSRSPYPKDTGMHMELDYDTSTPEGRGAAMLFKGTKNFLNSQGPLRRSLRRVIGYLQMQTLQIQQLAHIYPDLADLTFFNNTNTNYNRYKASRQALPDQLLDYWTRQVGKNNYHTINKALQEEAESKKNWFDIVQTTKTIEGREVPWSEFQMTEIAKQELAKRGIDIDTPEGRESAQHILSTKNSLLDSLNEDERILIRLLAYRMGHEPVAFRAAITSLKNTVQGLRQVPFFPQGRFGNMMLFIEKRKASGTGFDVVWKEKFEKEGEWLKAIAKAEAAAQNDPNTRVRKHLLTDTQYVLMALPKDFVDLMSSELGLSDDQLDTLQQILQPIKQEKLLSQYDQAKYGVKGYTSDAARSYANFTWHHANLQAKLLHRVDFNLAITRIRSRLREAEYAGSVEEVQRLNRVARMMESARDYIMSPPNEMQSARALVSVAYLWLNAKTALLNFYGLVTVYGHLWKTFGTIGGTKRFVEANQMMIKSMKLSDLNDRRKGDYLPPDIQKGLDRAIEEGVLSQSYAYHLASMANATNLARMSAYQAAGKVVQQGIDLGMYPFRLVELATRRVAFIATLQEELAKKNAGFDEAYTNAVAQVNKLQNDYSLGNRVPFMRGGAFGLGPVSPMAMIFASFAQHMAFHGYGGFELGNRRAIEERIKEGELSAEHMPKWYQWGGGYTARIWLLTLIVAGYEGLPGAENLIDIIEAVWRKVGGKKGFRQELRELVQSIDGDPELFARGLGHNVMGFDLSRSLGFGRIFPGTDNLAKSAQENTQEMIGSTVLDMAGPAGGVIKFGLGTVSDKPLAETMKQFPGGIGNLWTAYQWSKFGVRGPNGGLITLDEDRKPRDLTTLEVYGKALGFNPTIVSENREKFYVSHDRQMYFQSKRKGLLDDLNRADWQKDVEGKTDARRAISEFNAGLPQEPAYQKIKITPKDIAQSRTAHIKGRRAEESGQPTQKRYRGLNEDIRESFEKP